MWRYLHFNMVYFQFQLHSFTLIASAIISPSFFYLRAYSLSKVIVEDFRKRYMLYIVYKASESTKNYHSVNESKCVTLFFYFKDGVVAQP